MDLSVLRHSRIKHMTQTFSMNYVILFSIEYFPTSTSLVMVFSQNGLLEELLEMKLVERFRYGEGTMVVRMTTLK